MKGGTGKGGNVLYAQGAALPRKTMLHLSENQKRETLRNPIGIEVYSHTPAQREIEFLPFGHDRSNIPLVSLVPRAPLYLRSIQGSTAEINVIWSDEQRLGKPKVDGVCAPPLPALPASLSQLPLRRRADVPWHEKKLISAKS